MHTEGWSTPLSHGNYKKNVLKYTSVNIINVSKIVFLQLHDSLLYTCVHPCSNMHTMWHVHVYRKHLDFVVHVQ